MKNYYFFLLIASVLSSCLTYAQKYETAILEISSTSDTSMSATKTVEIRLPKSQASPVGGTGALVDMVSKALRDNHVDCPPQRSKIADNVWLCGNGKKITTNNLPRNGQKANNCSGNI